MKENDLERVKTNLSKPFRCIACGQNTMKVVSVKPYKYKETYRNFIFKAKCERCGGAKLEGQHQIMDDKAEILED